MNKILTSIILSLSITNIFGQINMNDSSAQVVGYWNIGDKESYNVSLQKIKQKNSDTIFNELMTYEIDVTVIDSTENSYSLEWFYYNYKTNSKNEIVKKLTSLTENLKVIIETDEFGTIKGVKNWQEIRDYIKKSVNQIKDNVEDIPNMNKLLKQIEGMYTTKAAIESNAIQDIQQFYSYHGGKYLHGEVLEFSVKLPNIYNPNKPFDAKTTIYLDELNPTVNNFILRSNQEVDPEQLTNTTFEYMKKMSKTLKVKAPEKEDIGTLKNTTTIDSRIHGTGWPIYSILKKTVSTMDATNIEERIIEIK